MKIAVAGTGYVGLSIATLLAQHHEVMAVDIIEDKVNKINNRISPIQDEYIEKYLKEKELNLTATLNAEDAYKDAVFVIIAAPTNYDSKKNFFEYKCSRKCNSTSNGNQSKCHHGHQKYNTSRIYTKHQRKNKKQEYHLLS